jgi:hypothetical protein
MSGIQIILISAFVFIALYYYVRLKNRLSDVLLLLFLVALAVLFILFPEWTNGLARRLGVGRGADLLFYTCIVLFVFVVLKLYSRIRHLEQITTELLRKEAKDNATHLTDESI